MEILYLLIPISVVLVFLIGTIFWWALRNGQFDDLEGPAYRILMDDDQAQQKATMAAQENPIQRLADDGQTPPVSDAQPGVD